MNKRKATHQAQCSGGKARGPLFAAPWNQLLIAGLPHVTLVKADVRSGWCQGLQRALSLYILFPSKDVWACSCSSQKKPSLINPAIMSVGASATLLSCSRNKVYLLMKDCKAGDSLWKQLMPPHTSFCEEDQLLNLSLNLGLSLKLTLCNTTES